MNEQMNEAKLSSLLTSNVEPNEIAVIYEKSQVLNMFQSSYHVQSRREKGKAGRSLRYRKNC